jgi:hypothetical protein
LKRAARVGEKRILVAPSTLYEALRINCSEARARRAKLITDAAWTRLMGRTKRQHDDKRQSLGQGRAAEAGGPTVSRKAAPGNRGGIGPGAP